MEKRYCPADIEPPCYERWEKAGYFKPHPGKSTYCIILPPPNVTGTLHMGHGFQVSLMDALIRYHRMKGFSTLWQAGTDHAGIATQMVVERQLAKENLNRYDLGRKKFIERVWEWKHSSENKIKNQLRRMGASLDWSREYFTLDPQINRAVQSVFIQLYKEGLLYRGKRLVNWDPVLQTAISDLEVINREEKGHLWYIRYPFVNHSTQYLTVATTRPETLFGDVAVAVHPEDERYRHWVGQSLQLPLTTRKIPVLADPHVDPEFGTGCVKITPAHDFNDYQIGQRHRLPLINIFTKEARLNTEVPDPYQGLDRFTARKKIIETLTQRQLIEKVEPHFTHLPYGDRTNALIEPYLTDQWFIRCESLAKAALQAVANNEIKFIPEHWKKTYFQWLDHIEDWCISRQLWWGHRIPAWYDNKGQVYVGTDEPSIRAQHQLSEKIPLTQDQGVLDTWFSSALWPFATLGWPQKTTTLKQFYPNCVLVTGFDIIFFWVARMVMMGLKFTQHVPFKEVYITGLIRDSEGQKMSKSKGNVLDPIDLIEGIKRDALIEKRTADFMTSQDNLEKIKKLTQKEFPDGIEAFGADAVRFTYCALANTGRDIRFDLKRVEGYRNFCNKLWNATRYVLLTLEQYSDNFDAPFLPCGLVGRWIMSSLQHTIESAHRYFREYRFDLLAQTLYEFIWNEYCDWYLELSKVILNSESFANEKQETYYTLLTVLDTSLKLLHPLMPFITETLWLKLPSLLKQKKESLMIAPYPELQVERFDAHAEANISFLKHVTLGIRNIRGEMNLSPKKEISIILQGIQEDYLAFESIYPFVQALCNIKQWKCQASSNQVQKETLCFLVGTLNVHVSIEGLIDKEKELKRLDKEIEKLKKELVYTENKLNNTDYLNKAPQSVVLKVKDQYHLMRSRMENLKAQREKIL